MNYTHLTIEERACLRKYYMEGKSFREIARLLGRSPSTISREIGRDYTHRYSITHITRILHKRNTCYAAHFAIGACSGIKQ